MNKVEYRWVTKVRDIPSKLDILQILYYTPNSILYKTFENAKKNLQITKELELG